MLLINHIPVAYFLCCDFVVLTIPTSTPIPHTLPWPESSIRVHHPYPLTEQVDWTLRSTEIQGKFIRTWVNQLSRQLPRVEVKLNKRPKL
jgi:hypothetical protein